MAQQQKLYHLQQQDRQQPFALDQSPLFRLRLFKLSASHYVFLFTHHHAILDGWSNQQLFAHVHKTYQALLAGHTAIPRVHDAYPDTQAYLQQQHSKRQAFWAEYLADLKDRPNLEGLFTPEARAQHIRLEEVRYVQTPEARTSPLAALAISN